MVEGSFYDHDGICRAGEFVWRRTGSFHETHSDEGAVILAIYRKPNVFQHSTGYTRPAKSDCIAREQENCGTNIRLRRRPRSRDATRGVDTAKCQNLLARISPTLTSLGRLSVSDHASDWETKWTGRTGQTHSAIAVRQNVLTRAGAPGPGNYAEPGEISEPLSRLLRLPLARLYDVNDLFEVLMRGTIKDRRVSAILDVLGIHIGRPPASQFRAMRSRSSIARRYGETRIEESCVG